MYSLYLLPRRDKRRTRDVLILSDKIYKTPLWYHVNKSKTLWYAEQINQKKIRQKDIRKLGTYETLEEGQKALKDTFCPKAHVPYPLGVVEYNAIDDYRFPLRRKAHTTHKVQNLGMFCWNNKDALSKYVYDSVFCRDPGYYISDSAEDSVFEFLHTVATNYHANAFTWLVGYYQNRVHIRMSVEPLEIQTMTVRKFCEMILPWIVQELEKMCLVVLQGNRNDDLPAYDAEKVYHQAAVVYRELNTRLPDGSLWKDSAADVLLKDAIKHINDFLADKGQGADHSRYIRMKNIYPKGHQLHPSERWRKRSTKIVSTLDLFQGALGEDLRRIVGSRLQYINQTAGMA